MMISTITQSKKLKQINCEIADTFFKRLLGLSFRKSLPPNNALWIIPCNSVHMCFMRFSIDVIYLDADNRIKKIVTNLKPWIGLSICIGAKSVLEMSAGESSKLNLNVGEKLELIRC